MWHLWPYVASLAICGIFRHTIKYEIIYLRITCLLSEVNSCSLHHNSIQLNMLIVHTIFIEVYLCNNQISASIAIDAEADFLCCIINTLINYGFNNFPRLR